MPSRRSHACAALIAAVLALAPLYAQTAPKVTTPKEAFGFNIGDDYQLVGYTQMEAYWKKLASESPRMRLVDIGRTAEGKTQRMAIITSPENMARLDRYKEISRRLALAEGLNDEQARALAAEGKAVVWIDGGLHATETAGAQQLIEMVYQMTSRTDPETMRFLNDIILLCVPANPDGQELVANWYLREKEPARRSLGSLPVLYQKYIGHDNNRDFFMSAMPETTNMNRVLFHEWFPQLMYNHHQSGPQGTVIFMPPFRDPFNYNFDPLVPLGIEMVGTAMHSRLVAEGKGGSVMRSGSDYSTWWNGGLRTVTYFHNMIGILTEIIGNPTPMNIPLVPDKQLPQGDWPMPVAPQTWHFRQSIDYSITNNRALLDIASRYRETWLYNIYQMGRNSIEKGSRDSWTVTPARIDALKKEAEAQAAAAGQAPAGRGGRGTVPSTLYNTVLRDPGKRDPRGFIIPSGQPDFPTAIEFANALIKTGITVLRADRAFEVAGKSYPAGSLVVKTAQAFRPHILDMFEPQDHPRDFRYPGGPPNRPYDNTGWTLAMQMGVQFDRVLDAFEGPFTPVKGELQIPVAAVSGPANAAGYLISHRANGAFIVVNRLLKAKCDVYWLKQPSNGEPAGSIWAARCPALRGIVERGAKELGIAARGLSTAPAGEALKLTPVRVALVDVYGGSMPSGWTRWIFEQYEVPFELVFPPDLEKGELRSKFDVIAFPSGTMRSPDNRAPVPELPANIPDQYRSRFGVVNEKTAAQLRNFAEAGGTLVAVGTSSESAMKWFDLPVKNHLTEKDAQGKDRALPPEKFYIPGSLLRVNIDTTHPLAYGLPETLCTFFDNSPVFRLEPSAAVRRTSAAAWYPESGALASGWAWGESYLEGGSAVVDAALGNGRVALLGPEVTFRSQPRASFKLLFNALYYGTASAAVLK